MRAVERRERRALEASPRRPGWSLRRYMAVFMVVLLAVALGAALAVRSMAAQDAQQADIVIGSEGVKLPVHIQSSDLGHARTSQGERERRTFFCLLAFSVFHLRIIPAVLSGRAPRRIYQAERIAGIAFPSLSSNRA